MKEYIGDYYNTNRAHQGMECKTPIPSPGYIESNLSDSEMISRELLGGLYHTYKKVA